MTASSILLGGLALAALATSAMAEQASREQDIVDLRLGQRILVDDGSCPPGEIKEVSGATDRIRQALSCATTRMREPLRMAWAVPAGAISLVWDSGMRSRIPPQ